MPRTILFVNDNALAMDCSGRVIDILALLICIAVAPVVDDNLGGSE